jgi:modulator of FtsH protease HflK
MSWNEPGGGSKKPQDLFSGGASSGSGSPSGVSGAALAVVGLVAVLIWAVMGIYQVDEQERGVVLRFGKYLDTVQPGLHWNPRLIDHVTRLNITKVRSATFRETMLTQDENIVEVKLSIQYVITDPVKFVLQVRDPERSLQHASQSALRHVVGGISMDMVLGRAQMATDVQKRLQEYLDLYQTGILVSKVTVDESKPPSQVQSAFDDVIKAREDEERVQNEAQAYANSVVPEARGGAQRQIEEANAYKEQVIANAEGEAERFNQLLKEYRKSPEVTRERLYLDAVQAVLSQTDKVMVDVEGGNNVMYLPLDKLSQQNQRPSSQGDVGLESTNIRELTNAVTEQLRADAAAADGRRGVR